MRNRQETMDKIGTTGTNGHLKPLSKSGFCFLRIIIEIARNINPERVPIFTSSMMAESGTNAAMKLATTPTSRILVTGDLNLGCTLENKPGNNPSLLIEKNILV